MKNKVIISKDIKKKIYLKKIKKIADFNVYYVNGEFIRTNLEEEFTNFGQHYRFRFIPKNEFWIDNEHSPGEANFFIDHMLIENRLMKKGMSYYKAIEISDKKEISERRKSHYYIKKTKGNKFSMDKIHKKFLKKYSNDIIKVWIVNGELVRDKFFIDFTEGGHHVVYNFVPKNEIWLDDDLSLRELKFVLLHEMHERNLMSKGWSYEKAHESSSNIEYYCRRHPSLIKKYLLKEVKKM